MEYIFIASNKAGQKQKGLLEANTQSEVLDYLRQKELLPILVKVRQKSESSIFDFFTRVRGGDVILFTRQLASMITTGLTVIESLNILKQQNNKPQMQKIINELIISLSEGNSLSNALSYYPNVFSITYVALIQSAEQGGILDKVLERLALNLEKSDEIKKRVKAALIYPAIVITGIVLVLIMMNVFVIPQMATVYESLNIELPLMTKIVLFGSKLTTTLLPFSIVFIVIGGIAFRRFSRSPNGIQIIDKAKLSMPVFGTINTLSILSEVTRTISLLVGSGTSLINTLSIAADVSGNYYYSRAISKSSNMVEKGAGLAVAMGSQAIFPPLMIQLVKVGESTGKLDESLLKVSEYFERDLEIKVRTITTAIEPILIIVLGVSVAFLIISVITPIYSLVSQIQ